MPTSLPNDIGAVCTQIKSGSSAMTICFPFSLYYSWDNSLRLKRLWAELQGPQEDNGLAGISTKILCEMIPKNIANPLSSRGSTILGCIRG